MYIVMIREGNEWRDVFVAETYRQALCLCEAFRRDGHLSILRKRD